MADYHRIHPVSVGSPPQQQQPSAPPEHGKKPSHDQLLPVTAPAPYSPAPLPPPRRSRRRHSRCCRCVCYTFLALVLLAVALGATAGILYLVFRPKIPTFHVDRLTVTRFDVNATSATVTDAFDVDVTANNPNRRIGIYYDGGDVTASFNGTVLCGGAFPALYQGHRTTVHPHISLTGETRLDSDVAAQLLRQRQAGFVPLTVRARVPIRIKFGAIRLWKMTGKANCNLVVDNIQADIDECKRPDLYPCSSDGICKNTLLGYDCPCKTGMKGDGKKGTCHAVFPLAAKMTVGVIGGFFVVAALIFHILLRKEKRKMREFYEKNGGPILEKAKMIKLFKKEELKGILKESNLIGKGCFGEVYKGHLDNELVAVKKPISGTMLENEQFANEVIIQSQVIHKNIVRLIGCCLEVDRPMLVYEFIPRGNLEDILHGNKYVPLSMDLRLSIAAQAADGLAYMHSKTNTKILHGDVKPANILLDDNFMPKISDFGISRLIPKDKQHTDEVIGDESYMDPVYKETGLLTEKSDVYSFGVVILELVSRKKGIKDTHSDDNTLVKEFRKAHQEEKTVAELFNDDDIVVESNLEQEKRVRELFDDEIAVERNLELLHSLAKIALKCLNPHVDQRPSMIQVAEQLLLLLNRSHNP